RQVSGPPGGATGLRPPGGGATGLRPPGGATGLRPPGGATGLRPPGGGTRQVSGPQAERRAPSHQHDSGLRVNCHDRWHPGSDIGSSGWTAGIGSPGIRSFGSTVGTASSGKTVGSRVTRHDSGL
ncbi:unnamed protein product, partial [Staurois parvus]